MMELLRTKDTCKRGHVRTVKNTKIRKVRYVRKDGSTVWYDTNYCKVCRSIFEKRVRDEEKGLYNVQDQAYSGTSDNLQAQAVEAG